MAFRMLEALVITILFTTVGGGHQRTEAGEVGMYCGGNMIVQSDEVLRAANVKGVVLDPSRAPVGNARVQVEAHGTTEILVDIRADKKGRFRLPTLRPGRYWVGISSPGFNLHVWDLEVNTRVHQRSLKVVLSLGL